MTLDRDLVAAALPNYEIDGELGRGGWGVVLHGRHVALGREVAIKQLPPGLGEEALQRFVDEARIIAQLDHPHIVKVYDFVEHNGLWLMVMEYLSGGTLWSRFTEQGLRSDQACVITMAVCAGLSEANEHGVLHRDIKPENILFTDDGVPRVGDFGIARDLDVDTRRTMVGEVVGTPTYMSPEQAMGHELTRACDVYSVALVLYEMLAGRLPFDEARTPSEQLIQHATEPPVGLAQAAPEVPAAIADVVMDALEKRPEERIPTAQDFGVALALAAGETYGAGWLRESGVPLMGGGRIQEAAHRSPTSSAQTVAPMLVQPVQRGDHFRPTGQTDSGSPSELETSSTTTPSPTIAPVVATAATIGPISASVANQDTVSGSAVLPSGSASNETISAAAAPPSAAPPSDPNRRLWMVAGGLVAAVALAVVLVLALTGGGNDDADIADTAVTVPPETTSLSTTSGTTSVTTQPSSSSLVGAVVTVPEARLCPEAERCTFIDSVVVDGDSLVIEWTAVGFEPSYEEGFVHAHFFWDIYSADQAGTNAATFGVSEGAWEITDEQPFRSSGEMRVGNRPIPANQICVTAGNFAHAVVNPLNFDCAPIPAGM